MSRETAPELSVVIPSRDGAARLGETLASIVSQEGSGPFETVVVDDGSSDGTSDLVRAAPGPAGTIRVVAHASPRGRAAACNTGIRAAAGEVIVILDDDMTLARGALESHRTFHRSAVGAGAIGRIVQVREGPEDCFGRFLAREEESRERALMENPGNVPFPLCLTGHFSAPRRLLLDAGGFDDRVTRYGLEDIEMAYRLSGRGVRIHFLSGATARHRAYMNDLERYLARHLVVGGVARELADRYPSGPFREYLRVDGPRRLGIGRESAGLVGLRLMNRLLLARALRRTMGSRPGRLLLLGALRLAAKLRLERAAHFGYHVARDLAYFQGYFSDRAADSRR